jgi:hypothetical protein
VANSREQPEPWLGGYVHVVEETMPLPEPVRTDPGSVHRLLFMPNGAKGLRERVAGVPYMTTTTAPVRSAFSRRR